MMMLFQVDAIISTHWGGVGTCTMNGMLCYAWEPCTNRDRQGERYLGSAFGES